MTANRLIPNSSTAGSITGDNFMDETQEEITALYDAAMLSLRDISGTGNAITASLTPALTGDLKAGMKFTFIAANQNTEPVTIAINGLSPIAIKNALGAPLTSDEIQANQLVGIEFDGMFFRIFGGGNGSNGGVFAHQTFTEDGVWTKPNGVNPNGIVKMELWSSGAGGTNNSTKDGGNGGGGGAWLACSYKISDLPETLNITVPPASPVTTNGNAAVISKDAVIFASVSGAVGQVGGSQTDFSDITKIFDIEFERGGNGGRGGRSSGYDLSGTIGEDGYDGTSTTRSGAGGAGAERGGGTDGTNGEAQFAGDGGDVDGTGQIPAGGGGARSAGARGEVRIRVIG